MGFCMANRMLVGTPMCLCDIGVWHWSAWVGSLVLAPDSSFPLMWTQGSLHVWVMSTHVRDLGWIPSSLLQPPGCWGHLGCELVDGIFLCVSNKFWKIKHVQATFYNNKMSFGVMEPICIVPYCTQELPLWAWSDTVTHPIFYLWFVI